MRLPDDLVERVARLYKDKWGVVDHQLARAVIAVVLEEAAKVAARHHPGSIIGHEIAAAIRALGSEATVVKEPQP